MDSHSFTPAADEFACAQAEVPRDGKVITRSIKGRMVAIARRSSEDDTIVAFESTCPHMKVSLRSSRVVDGEVICPWHFFRFDTTTGNAVACDKSIMKLKTYAVKVEDGNVYVGTMN